MAQMQRIAAVLGPTNTGKTHYAIERMLAHKTGVIGLPLRLLAREVYDRIVAIRGPNVVALVTGEERIVPDRTQYWVCTVEAMPEGLAVDFLAVDEIQLCGDPDRGHVFTDRLLHARGLHETLLLGADTMRPAIAALEPKAQFMRRDRMSKLIYAGEKKLNRMGPRSAVVSFSVDQVYGIAELLRRQRGGAAVVMGALSPRTRNKQVEIYQNGDVEFLVATDAIGMGLNLDIRHVAFSATKKFDGRKMRNLFPNELAQIAGRAGRHMNDGTFGTTGEARPFDPEVAEAICDSRFQPLQKLYWRNSDLQFGSLGRLIGSLEAQTQNDWLTRVRESDDLAALKFMAEDAEVAARCSDGPSVRLLWDVCRIPDFRSISATEHATLLSQIFSFLHEKGQIPSDWMARQLARIDRPSGDIDTLSKRLAFVRTWTYVAQRKGWVDDEKHWRGETRAVEDRLSDALHEALTQRFVDRRTSVLMRRLKQKERLVAEISKDGEVTVEGQFVGKLEGFRFQQDTSATPDEAKTLRAASLQALAPEFHLRADRFYNAPDTEIDFTDQGGLMWGTHAVGKLVKGAEAMKPGVHVFVDDEAGTDIAERVQRRLQHFIDRKIATLFEPLMNIQRDETLAGLARGFGFQLTEGLGVLDRAQVANDVKALDQDARGTLRKHGVRFGQYTIFMPLLLKPAPTRLRLVLWALAEDLAEFPSAPPPGLVTIANDTAAVKGYYLKSGYKPAGDRAIRVDMAERLADMLRGHDSRAGFEANPDMLSITGMTLDQFANLMEGLGYKAAKGEREKVKAVPAADSAPAETADTPTDATAQDTAQEDAAAQPAPAEDAAQDPAADATPDAAPVPDQGAQKEEASVDPAAPAEPEVEVYYTFTWGGRRPAGQDRRPNAAGKPKGKGPRKSKDARDGKAKTFRAAPPKKEKKIDPDNPFAAALMGLKDS